MFKNFRQLRFLVIALAIVSCGRDLPELENIDLKVWKEDRNGCTGKRREMMDSFRNQKDKLLALKETQIVELLGRPDGNELYERNQKFYYYNFTPSNSCPVPDSAQYQVEIRFNAMGLAKEILIK